MFSGNIDRIQDTRPPAHAPHRKVIGSVVRKSENAPIARPVKTTTKTRIANLDRITKRLRRLALTNPSRTRRRNRAAGTKVDDGGPTTTKRRRIRARRARTPARRASLNRRKRKSERLFSYNRINALISYKQSNSLNTATYIVKMVNFETFQIRPAKATRRSRLTAKPRYNRALLSLHGHSPELRTLHSR